MNIQPTALPANPAKGKRIHSIDLLRGIVMIIMALDHVRDYFHASTFLFDPTDLTRTDAPLFLTRWITHYCAPVFAFLAGASAFLNGTKKTKKELSVFLFTRGLWLVIVEALIITLGWSFNPAYPVVFLQVIWALGVSMMVLAAAIWLPRTVILVMGLILIFGHNILDPIDHSGNNESSFLISFLHHRHLFATKPFSFMLAYPIIPWIGIMLTGYVFGQLYLPTYDAGKRKRTLLWLGVSAVALFIIIRFINSYGDPRPWSVQQSPLFTFFSFLNVTKYPPSLLYTLMTLGPSLLFLAFAEKPLNRFTEKLVVFGRVPMFFYILHIYVIHVLAVIAAAVTGYKWNDMVLTGWISMNEQLKGYGFSLVFVFVLWMLIVIGFYPLCKRYDEYKRMNRSKWWLIYI